MSVAGWRYQMQNGSLLDSAFIFDVVLNYANHKYNTNASNMTEIIQNCWHLQFPRENLSVISLNRVFLRSFYVAFRSRRSGHLPKEYFLCCLYSAASDHLAERQERKS